MRKLNPGDYDWTDAAIARLTELWLAGHSSGECARHFGITRSAAIGKIGRLGLLRRDRPRPAGPLPAPLLRNMSNFERAIPVPKPRPEKRPHSRTKRQPKTPDRFFAEFAAKPLPPPLPSPPIGSFDLLELRAGDCRWPCSDGFPPYKFCGAGQAFGSSYCEEHTRRSLSGIARGTPYISPARQ